jgi:glycosyltransferase involved in cell wall biosynthesis
MRIAVVTWTRRLAGGAESVLAAPLPEFVAAGHELALCHEVDEPTTRGALPLPPGTVAWSAEQLGTGGTLDALRSWRPDVLLVHGMLDPGLERSITEVAPGVFVAHNYYGTCISGHKTLTLPRVRPCTRRFGWPCLLLYYPRRTGGLSPITMAREYRTQARRLANLRRYHSLAVLSEHMRDEYVRHGFPPDRVTRLPPPIAPARDAGLARAPAASRPAAHAELSLLFVGRMEPFKGGAHLLRAAARVAARLDRPVAVTLAGDGPTRTAWQALARRLTRGQPRLRTDFPGWVTAARRAELFARGTLLVVPSLWPEPFGLVGLEAAAAGLPAVAFAVGGIPDWLSDGVNGHLAPGDPPTVGGLADAIIRAVRDPNDYERLQRGALSAARRLDPGAHARALLDLLHRAAGDHGATLPA